MSDEAGTKGAPASRRSVEVAPDPVVGDVVGPYTLIEQLGKGGAGSVFKVERQPDGVVFALKVLAAAKVKRARIVQRFFDEVRAAGAVNHPGLVRVSDFIEEDRPRRLAYAMEYVPGEVLRARLKRDRTLDLRFAIEVARQIADALVALHEAGIIHRDLKPENILLGEVEAGVQVKLFDFGVVKFLPPDGGAHLDAGKGQPGTFVGTPRYMAPEQAAGSSVDHRADLYALGVMLFEMITGRCPHEGDSLRDVVMAKLAGAPRITVNPEQEFLPQELSEVVDRCLRLKPLERPGSAEEVGQALREAETVLLTVGSIRKGEEGAAVRNPLAYTPAPAISAVDSPEPAVPAPEPPPPTAAIAGAEKSSEALRVEGQARALAASRWPRRALRAGLMVVVAVGLAVVARWWAQSGAEVVVPATLPLPVSTATTGAPD